MWQSPGVAIATQNENLRHDEILTKL